MKRLSAVLLSAILLLVPMSVSYMAPDTRAVESEILLKTDSESQHSTSYQQRYRVSRVAAAADFTYAYDEDVVTITGYNGSGPEVIVPAEIEGRRVAHIGDSAFLGNRNIQRISLPDDFLSIGSNAFRDCANLEQIELGYALTSIGAQAFQNCSSLVAIRIPDTVTSVGASAFASCTNLNTVVLSLSMGSLETTIFQNCRSLETVNIPENVKQIRTSAFSGCTSLKEVALPTYLTQIGTAAFRGCSALTQIVIPPEVTSIPDNAFSGCSGLETVSLGASVRSIGSSAFAGCNKIYSLTFPAALTTINASAFSECTGLKELTATKALTSVDRTAFNDVAITSVTFYGSESDWDASQLRAALDPKPRPENVICIEEEEPTAVPSRPVSGEPTEEPEPTPTPNASALQPTPGPSPTAAVTPDSQPTAKPSASVSAQVSAQPEPSKTLEPLATDTPRPSPTADPTWIASATPEPTRTLEPLPTDTPSPGPQPSVPSLPAVDPGLLPEPDPSSGLVLSEDRRWLVKPREDGSAVVVAHSPSSTSVTVPSKISGRDGREYEVTGLSGYQDGGRWRSFLMNASAITRVSLPDSIRDIGSYTFYGCSRLGSIYLPRSITSIGDRSFSGCRSLTDITIPVSCTDVGRFAFENCSALESVRLLGEQTKIGTDAFKGCSRLLELVLGPNVRNIDPSVLRQVPAAKYVFYGAGPQTDLDDSSIPAVVREAMEQGFVRNVTIIPTSGADWKVEAPASVTPGAVVEVSLTVSGLPADVSEAEGVLDLVNLTFADSGATRSGGNVLVLPVRNGAASIRLMLRVTGQPGEAAVLEWGDVRLNGRAVADNAGRTVRIEAAVEDEDLVSEDGSWTFRASGQGDEAVLTSCAEQGPVITVPQTVKDSRGRTYRVTSIQGRRTAGGSRHPFFRHAAQVTRVILPYGLTSVGPYAFYGMTGLQSVSLPDTLLSIGMEAFSGCTDLTELALPAGLRSIGTLAFENCGALRSVTVPGPTSADGNVFYGCNGLAEMRLSRQVSVQRTFFLGLPALRTVWFGGTQTQLAASEVSRAFAYAKQEGYLPEDARIICEESPLWTLICNEPTYAGGSITLRIEVEGAPLQARRASGRFALSGLTTGQAAFSFPLSDGHGYTEIQFSVTGSAGDTAVVRLEGIEFDAEPSADEPAWESVILGAGGEDEPSPVPSQPDVSSDDAFTLMAGSPLTITGRTSYRYVRGLSARKGQPTMTVAEFLANFEAPAGVRYLVTDAGGRTLGADAHMATGCVLESWKGAKCLGRATVVVNGDVLGTGRLNVAQLVRMANALNGSNPLKGPYLLAGMRTEHSCMCITLTDLIFTAKELL